MENYLRKYLRRTAYVEGVGNAKRQSGREDEGTQSVERPQASGLETSSLSHLSYADGSALVLRASGKGRLPSEFVTMHPHLEAALLIHVFDVFLPAQFPFSQPSVADGRWDWMLALLLQTRPLYDAALSVADWHRGASMQAKHRRRSPGNGDDGE